jgi:hypothetical protein
VYQVDRQSVSWVRTRDAHILSVDGAVFVSDPRILVVTSPERAEWTLILKAFGGQTKTVKTVKLCCIQNVPHSVQIPSVKLRCIQNVPHSVQIPSSGKCPFCFIDNTVAGT